MAEKDVFNSYELSRAWFDWCFENPDMVKPTHTALYFFAIEHCNRLGWKSKFGLPTQMTMDAIGVKNWRTYSSAFNDIVDWGFFIVYEKSKNQYSATVIGIVKNTKAHTKALTKAMQKHIQKQSSSIAVINKPSNQEPNNQITEGEKKIFPPENNFNFFLKTEEIESYMTSSELQIWFDAYCMNNHITPEDLKQKIKLFVKDLIDKNIQEKSKTDLIIHFVNFTNNGQKFNKSGKAGVTASEYDGSYAKKHPIKSAI